MKQPENYNYITFIPGIASFGMTLIRICLAISCVHLIGLETNSIILTINIALIMILDLYDGMLFKSSSLYKIPFWRKVRRVFDSCGDRASIQIVCIPLLLVDSHFLLPYIIICFKEILTSTICIIEFKRGLILYPNKLPKISTLFVGLTTISAVFNNSFFVIITSLVLFCTGILSFISYYKLIKKFNTGLLSEGIDFESI